MTQYRSFGFWFRKTPLLLITTLVAACSNGGEVTLGVTDAPVDSAQHVYVQFTGVELQGGNGNTQNIDFGTDDQGNPITKNWDLLSLQNGQRDFLLNGHALDSGKYNWIRLKVNAQADGVYDSYIVINGSNYELAIPSGAETGLKLNTPFTISDQDTVDFTVDFNLRKSIHNPNGMIGPSGAPVYQLRPTLRLVDSNETGRISGTLDTAIFSGLTCSSPAADGYAVYAYSGSGVTADDIDNISPDPVTTGKPVQTDSGWQYTLAFLNPGDYTLAATCEGDKDDPDLNDAIAFVGTQSVSVQAGQNTVANFAP